MTVNTILRVLLRDLEGLRRELEAYPDDESLWETPPGINNSGGTLALHLVGSLRHFIGAVLGGSGYVRDRPGEFQDRNVPREEILSSIDSAMEELSEALENFPMERIGDDFPVPVGGVVLPMGVILVHFVAHFGFHLGQLDYHRRLTTDSGDAVPVLRVSVLDQS